MRQKTAEALFLLPCRTEQVLGEAQRISSTAHPYVQRAAALLSLRASVAALRQVCTGLIYHPDSAVSRVGLLFSRYQTDDVFAQQEVDRLERSEREDLPFVRNLYRFWSLRLSSNAEVRERVWRLLVDFTGSRSPIVRWHAAALLTEYRAQR